MWHKATTNIQKNMLLLYKLLIPTIAMRKLILASMVALVAFAASCGKETIEVEKPIYHTDTIYTTIRDTVNIPNYIYIHDTVKIVLHDTTTLTDTILIGKDDRQVSQSTQGYVNDRWSYIRNRISTCFTTDGATRVYMYLSYCRLHVHVDEPTGIIALVAIKDSELNSFTYFQLSNSLDSGTKYNFTNPDAQINNKFFDSLLLAVYTTTPSKSPFIP